MYEPTDMAAELQWRRAFAALPQLASSVDRWPQVAHGLQPRPRIRRRSDWLAFAAALAMLAVLPVWQGLHQEMQAGAPSAVTIATEPARAGETTTQALASAETAGTAVDTALAVKLDAATRAKQRPALMSRPNRIAHREPQPRRRSTAPVPPVLATTDALPGSTLEDGASPPLASEPGIAAAQPELSRLHAESARFEALLALARDERIANGMAVALADDMQAQLAQVDAELGQPQLAPAVQLDLWRQRVYLLQRLSGFETGQRLLAAQGTPYDPVLVALH
ncbi:MAG TPA: hypothetical protein VNI56_01380 [Xanthomonadaceae bacterium]|nr:hypothetical protein [Xanthomonadaceae bacterium]